MTKADMAYGQVSEKWVSQCPESDFHIYGRCNAAARGHNVFSLAEILKILLSETTKPIEL
jgi:hypothetical protein